MVVHSPRVLPAHPKTIRPNSSHRIRFVFLCFFFFNSISVQTMHAKRTNIFTREFWKRATWIMYHAQLACNDPDEIFWIQPNKRSFHIRICWVEIDCIGRTTTQIQAFTFNHFSPFQPYCIVWLLITAKLLLL